MHGTTKLRSGVLGAVAALVAVAGCAEGASQVPQGDNTVDSSASRSPRDSKSPDTYEYQLRSFGNDHAAFSLRLGPGETVGPLSTTTPTGTAGEPLRLVLERQDDVVATITADPADVPLSYPNTGLGNGRTGVYRTTADIPADEAAVAEHVRTVLGEATVFTHPYYECTNSCKHWTVPVAVITLAHPKDPRFPTLVIASHHDDLDKDTLTAILGRLAI